MLLNVEKEKLKNISVNLGKIVKVVVKYNPDEDVLAMLEEFDAFYVIEAALTKAKRNNEHQQEIYQEEYKKHSLLVKTHKSLYNRYHYLCKKHDEPLEVRKDSRTAIQKK